MLPLPKPHGDKLKALIQNPKLPTEDIPRIQRAIERYENWLIQLQDVAQTSQEIVLPMVTLLNQYKRYIDMELIFDSEQDFLYRQKGQLKLDNTIIEEFLPILVTSTLKSEFRDKDLLFGPATCFSGIRFESSITDAGIGGGMAIRAKDHDFTITRRVYIQSSYDANFATSTSYPTQVAYVAAECKTNLDKTMFQEASATASDVKLSAPGAKYFLLAEWLDMTPISTRITAIDEILILRKAKRISANVRKKFSTYQGRKENRQFFVDYLELHPFSVETFQRFLEHIHNLIVEDNESDILNRGYF